LSLQTLSCSSLFSRKSSGFLRNFSSIEEAYNTKTRRIRNNVKKLRFNSDEMTQQALADMVGVSRQTIHHIEAGKYSPSLELAFRIAIVFGMPLEEIFQYEPNNL